MCFLRTFEMALTTGSPGMVADATTEMVSRIFLNVLVPGFGVVWESVGVVGMDPVEWVDWSIRFMAISCSSEGSIGTTPLNISLLLHNGSSPSFAT